MGVDTKAIIRKDVSLSQIKETLQEKYGNVGVYNSGASDDYFRLSFKDGNDDRQLSVFFGDFALNDYKIDGVLLSLGFWGNGVEIVMLLLKKFGGYIDENDCDDIDFEPVNIEIFEEAKELSEMDKFVNKIVSKVGYDKLDVTLELFKEYTALNCK